MCVGYGYIVRRDIKYYYFFLCALFPPVRFYYGYSFHIWFSFWILTHVVSFAFIRERISHLSCTVMSCVWGISIISNNSNEFMWCGGKYYCSQYVRNDFRLVAVNTDWSDSHSIICAILDLDHILVDNNFIL